MDLSLMRRQLIKPSLGTYQELCKESVPVTEFLFGDIESRMKEVKTIKDANKEFKKPKHQKFCTKYKFEPYKTQFPSKNGYGFRYQDRYRNQYLNNQRYQNYGNNKQYPTKGNWSRNEKNKDKA